MALGYAVAFRRYALDYVSAEESAKAAKRGIWTGAFEMPDEYREAEGKQSPSRAPRRLKRVVVSSRNWAGRAKANCNIKAIATGKGSGSITFRECLIMIERGPKKSSVARPTPRLLVIAERS